MTNETSPESRSQELILTQRISELLDGYEWKPIKAKDRSGMIREVSIELPEKRILYISQDVFGGRLGMHNLVQVMAFHSEIPLPENKHIEWHEYGTELKDAPIEQPFDLAEILDELERSKNG